MKVLVVTPWFPNNQRPGEGIFNLRDVELLLEDHQVTVLYLHAPDAQPLSDHLQEKSGFKFFAQAFQTQNFKTVFEAQKTIRKLMLSHDVVHSMAFPAVLPIRLARLSKKKLSNIPWVHTEHWSGLTKQGPPSLRGKLATSFLKAGLKKPDEIVAVSKNLAQTVNGYRKKIAKASVIGNYVYIDEKVALPTAPEKRGSDKLILIGVGGLVAHKNPLLAVKTVKELKSRGYEVELRWAGKGPQENEVRALTQFYGLFDEVNLLGHQSSEDLVRNLSKGHLFLLPTDSETFGVAIAEALGAGLPVVTTGIGGHLEFLPPEASRVVPQTPQALAQAVIELIEDEGRWQPQVIREYAVQKFSNKVRKQAYLSVYRKASRVL